MNRAITLTLICWASISSSLAIAQQGAEVTTVPSAGPAYPTEFKDLMNSGIDPKALREQIVRLRDEYESADKRAHALAKSLRESPDDTKNAELRSAVMSAFLSRQGLLQSELMEMQIRLIQSQASLQNRNGIRDQIVDRRVEDLLNPKLQWEQAGPIDLPQESESLRGATTVPPATEEQKARWRSAIVDLHVATPDRSDVLVGRGVVASPTGLILTNITRGLHLDNREVSAVFDDGRRLPLTIMDDSGAGFYSLQPPAGTQINHHFDCAVIPHAVGDEVYICGYKTDGSQDFEVLPTKLVLNDRKVPNFGTPGWQLQHVPTLGTVFCQPLVAADGRLVGISTAGLGKPNEPLLACSAAGFDLLFAKAKLNVASDETPASVATTMPAISSTLPETTVSELEGQWHQVAYSDANGLSQEIRPYNRTFKGNRSTVAWAGGGHECRIKVNTDVKTIWYFSKEEDGSFMMDHYELRGDQLILSDDPGEGKRVTVYERGHVRIPAVVPTATKQQDDLWRSAIVEILVSGKTEGNVDGPKTVGFGAIIAADGTLVSHMSGGWSHVLKDWPNVDAKFDDGSHVPLEIVDESSGVVILRPKHQVDLNHHFPLSVGPTRIGDEVYVGQLTVPSLDNRGVHNLAATKLQLSRTDRRVATLGIPVWQLNSVPRIPNSYCLPVLSGDGELLAFTMTDTGGLLLAIPTAQLQEMFPRTLKPEQSADVVPADSP